MKLPLFKKRKKLAESENEQEYVFIWYKKMEVGNKTIFTQPFRTRVMAKSEEEAKNKVTNFALGKMKLVIVPEKDYRSTQLSNLSNLFEELNEKMKKIFN